MNIMKIKFARTLCSFIMSVFITVIGLLVATAQAADSFWQAVNSEVISSQVESANSISSFTASQEFDLQGQSTNQRILSFTQDASDSSSFSIEYADAYDGNEKQRNVVLGYTRNNLSLSVMNATGDDIARLGGDYSGIDPYLFHGGVKQRFKVNGYALDYGFGNFGHMQYGQATVQSDGLDDRRSRYFEWSNNSMFARASRFSRGGENIGDGMEFGFAIDRNKMLAVQTMQLDNDRSMQRIRLKMNGKYSKQYWVDLSTHQNALYRQNDDFQVMFNFKTVFGAKKLASYQNSTGSNDQVVAEGENGSTSGKKNNKALRRGLYIGAGVVAVAALASSGSSKQDDNSRFRTQLDAAFDVLNGINPTSIRENREYGGWVFVNQDGSYASTTPVRGEAASVRLPLRSAVIPNGSRSTATYHTHAAFDPRYDNENFSPTDISSDESANVDGYLATPGGQFKYHNVRTGEITTIGSIATN